MTFITRPTLDLDRFDLLWKDFFNSTSNFADITHKVTHPTDIYETEKGITIEVAVVGLDPEDIEITTEGDVLRIKYDKPQSEDDKAIYKGIKKSKFDLAWKVVSKFDITKAEVTLDKGLLKLDIPIAEGKELRKLEIKTQETPQKLKSKKK